VRVTSDFESGSGEVLSIDGKAAEIALCHDTGAEFRQWFHLRVDDAPIGKPCVLRIVNAGDATYPDAWSGYHACASYDGETWFRVPTAFEDGVLAIEHAPERSSIAYAYFAPYIDVRRARLRDRARAAGARVERLGASVEGRAVFRIVLGTEATGTPTIWIIARQHPGETMAEWLVEGLVDRLLDAADPVARELLSRATFHVVPCMNPDGSALGNLRANAAGVNLNRAWLEPSPEESPEVLCVREAMEESGVDLFLDVHGDERNPFCFLAGCEGNPSYSERLRFLENTFEQALCALDDDFQDEYGYERDEPGGGDLRTAGNWVGERFDCLSFVLEMPFKDVFDRPDPERGWSPERCQLLGRAVLEAILASGPPPRP
jgi:murein tripeptide amidase MpaA